MTENGGKLFILYFEEFQKDINENAVTKGFWEDETILRSAILNSTESQTDAYKDFKIIERMATAEKIALAHSELSEALERLRKGTAQPDEHCPEFTNFEIELADTVIRIMDLAYQRDCRLPEAMIAKHEFNKTRGFKHGKLS